MTSLMALENYANQQRVLKWLQWGWSSRWEPLQVLGVLSSWQPVAAELGLSICPHANPRAIALEGPRGLGPGCDAAEEGRLQHSCIHGCNSCLLAVYAHSYAQMRSTDKVSICRRAPLEGLTRGGFRPSRSCRPIFTLFFRGSI